MQKETILFHIIEYLNRLKATTADSESVEVAIQCLGDSFHLSLQDPKVHLPPPLILYTSFHSIPSYPRTRLLHLCQHLFLNSLCLLTAPSRCSVQHAEAHSLGGFTLESIFAAGVAALKKPEGKASEAAASSNNEM
jgi:hypothetical protein